MKPLNFTEALAVDPKSVHWIEEHANPIEGIEGFKYLITLNIAGNVHVKNFGFLNELRKLEELDLQGLNLIEIPQEVANLEKLQTLVLSNNNITSLLKKLTHLVSIDLSCLGLRKIPIEILNLTDLKVLKLNKNSITNASPLKALQNLEGLYLRENSLKEIPKELKKLKHLGFLDISGNWKLKNCEVISELVGLEGLVISSGYDMERFPAGMFKLTQLKCLKIYVHSKSESDAIDGLADHCLENLENLSIQNSSLSSLPNSILRMKKLKYLTITGNDSIDDCSSRRM